MYFNLKNTENYMIQDFYSLMEKTHSMSEKNNVIILCRTGIRDCREII